MERPLPPPPRVDMDDQMRRWLEQLSPLIPRIQKFVYVLDPASINGTTESTQSFTASGLLTQDTIFVNVSLTAGVILHANARVPSDDRIELYFRNTTGGAIDQASTTFNVIAIR